MNKRIQARESRRLRAIIAAILVIIAFLYAGHMDFQDEQAKTQGPSVYFNN